MLSDWLYATTDQTHRFALEKLFVLLHRAMIEVFGLDREQVEQRLLLDFERSGLKGLPRFLNNVAHLDKSAGGGSVQRQKRHLK